MKKSVIIAIIVALVVISILVATTIKQQNKSEKVEKGKAMYTKITAEEAKQIMDNEPDTIILDVRSEEEYVQGHIKNSLLIPLDKLEDKAETEIEDKNIKILVYCRSGNRSKAASQILISMGYTNIFDFGGILDWKYEIED